MEADRKNPSRWRARVDLHVHSSHSCDCEFSMRAMCEGAIDQGIRILGFSDHFDLLPLDPCFNFFKADRWWSEFERCRATYQDELKLLAGIEIGEPHRYAAEVSRMLESYPWDYSLGSLHYVGDQNVFSTEYFDRGKTPSYADYFTELRRLVDEGQFQILAHMDIVKRYGFDFHGEYDPVEYEDHLRAILNACARRGIGLEVNTSTLRRPIGQTTPSRPILDWFQQEGGEWVTFGSDAHNPTHVGFGLEVSLQSLQQAGFDDLAYFERGTPTTLTLQPESPSNGS